MLLLVRVCMRYASWFDGGKRQPRPLERS
jgi:hypothetical protein